MEMSEDIVKHSCRYFYDVKTETQCLNVTWTFLKYSEVTMERNYYISPFSPDSEFQLELKFTKQDNGIWLQAWNKVKGNFKCDVFAVILDENGKELYQERRLGATLDDQLYLIAGTHSTFYEQLGRSCPNDTVIFEIEFRLKNVKPWDLNLCDWDSDKNLSEDLKKFILEMLPTEAVLKTKDDTIFVNKAILSARSPVFKKLFHEQEKNTILIDDLMGSTVRNLYDFLYSGKVDLKIELCYLKELYYAADKYGVMNLRDLCAANIIPMLTIENWYEVFDLARECSDEHLEKGCIIFIGRHMDTFMETKYWTDLKSSAPDLAIQIFEFYVKGVPVRFKKY